MNSGWPWTSLGEVLLERNETPIQEDVLAGQIRIVAKISFSTGTIDLRSSVETKTPMILVHPGDLLVSGINAAKGAIALYGEENKLPIAATIHYGCYQIFKAKAEPRFLWWLLRSEFFREILSRSVPGGIKTELKSKRLLPVQIPLPPLQEQRRILAWLDRVSLKIKQANTISRQTLEEVRALMPSALGKVFRELAEIHGTRPLGELCQKITDGPHKTPDYVTAGVPFVTVQNMVTGKLSFDNLKYITTQDHADISKRCCPERGDVLYSKDGATRGWPCYVDTDRAFNIFVSVALLKPCRDKLDGRFLCHLFRSSWIRDVMAEKSRGDMIPHIVLGEISKFPVPKISLDEQLELLPTLDSWQQKADALARVHLAKTSEFDGLMPSILSHAFSGQL